MFFVVNYIFLWNVIKFSKIYIANNCNQIKCMLINTYICIMNKFNTIELLIFVVLFNYYSIFFNIYNWRQSGTRLNWFFLKFVCIVTRTDTVTKALVSQTNTWNIAVARMYVQMYVQEHPLTRELHYLRRGT